MHERTRSPSGPADDQPATGILAEGVLGSVDITFMVLAVAAPMAIVVATMPISFALGNGMGVAGTYALSGLAIALFAIGYVRLLPHIRNAGAFYAIIAQTFGRTAGLAGSYVALVSYVALCCATLGALSYFVTSLLHTLGLDFVHWGVSALTVIAILALLSYFRIDFTAKLLAIALGAEVIAILALDVAILLAEGFGAPGHIFAPSVVLAPGLGVSAIYAFNSVIGFEATAIYQEEARNPEVSIPRATYAAIGVICLFYVFTAYAFIVASGPGIGAAAGKDPGQFVFGLARHYLGRQGEAILSLLVISSAFAAVLGLFNNSARYVFALARDGALPARLARTRSANGAPFNAGLPVILILSVVISLFALAGLDPLLSLTTALTGFGSVGLMALLTITAFAIPVFLRKRTGRLGLVSFFPFAGGAMLATGTILSVANYPLLTGTDSTFINRLPALLLVIAGIGVAQALLLRRRRPEVFARIGLSQVAG
ncbi:amino acid permease-associated region [Rhizorhabdus wittichii RW1]|uniref:Amino acid permease-associated region n=1 Tax=Rhizorhabdus wittichii (strain DSM 6014 / CCUG 31198 / JCM 15750 / NBRC 105917 / EY 4224 / RW1) TaxID=392499 RepID=A0A9J9LF87_RHIWR|nr:amino acid permease-associated region [Rhizorhabdus wittichii RW1]